MKHRGSAMLFHGSFKLHWLMGRMNKNSGAEVRKYGSSDVEPELVPLLGDDLSQANPGSWGNSGKHLSHLTYIGNLYDPPPATREAATHFADPGGAS